MTDTTLLVTGGAGFIGVNLVRRLVRTTGSLVVNLDKLTYAGNLESLADLANDPHHRFVQGDIGDRDLVASLLRQYQPKAILNLAAESHVDRSISDAAVFIQTNVVGTFNLLEETRRYWAELAPEAKAEFRFLHVSTDEVYGSLGESGRFTEESRTLPNSPYSASKAASDHFVRAYGHTYGLPTLTTNCSNNYGPFQFPEKLIPLIITSALDGKPLPVYGDGGNVRDWIYVEDHCAAVQVILERGRTGEVYNIGAGEEQRNIDVIQQICAVLEELRPARENPRLSSQGKERYLDLVTYVPDRPGHDRRYAIDPAKIQTETGWNPSVSFLQGLRLTIQWYLEHPGWIDHVRSGAYREWLQTNYSWRLPQ